MSEETLTLAHMNDWARGMVSSIKHHGHPDAAQSATLLEGYLPFHSLDEVERFRVVLEQARRHLDQP